jgi:hypothetical protein
MSDIARQHADAIRTLLPPVTWKEIVTREGGIMFYHETLWRYMDVDCFNNGDVLFGVIHWSTGLSHVRAIDMKADLPTQIQAMYTVFKEGVSK